MLESVRIGHERSMIEQTCRPAGLTEPKPYKAACRIMSETTNRNETICHSIFYLLTLQLWRTFRLAPGSPSGTTTHGQVCSRNLACLIAVEWISAQHKPRSAPTAGTYSPIGPTLPALSDCRFQSDDSHPPSMPCQSEMPGWLGRLAMYRYVGAFGLALGSGAHVFAM